MPLAVSPPAVVATARDAWFLAPAAGRSSFAWLSLPAFAATPDLATQRAGDALFVRRNARTTTVERLGCRTTSACFGVYAPNAAAGDGYVFADAAGTESRYVKASLPTFGVPILLAADDTGVVDVDENRYVAAGDALAVWVQRRALVARLVDASGPIVTWLAAGRTGGTVTGVATNGHRVAWTSRDTAGRFHVHIKTSRGAAPREILAAAPGVTLTRPALASDGTLVVGRRVPQAGGATRDEVVAIPGGGGDARVVMRSGIVPAGKATPIRPSISGWLVVARLQMGTQGSFDAIRAVDLRTDAQVYVALERRTRARLSDPAVSAPKILFVRTGIAGATRGISTVRYVKVRATAS